MDTLAMVLWTTAAGGLVSLGIGMARPGLRRRSLVVAAALFVPIGVGGILSVGVVFLLLAVLCLVAAARSPRGGARTPSRQARW